MRRIFQALVLGVMVQLTAAAPATAGSVDGAKQVIDNLGKSALNIINSSASVEKKQQRLEQLFSSSVDIAWVGRFVMGRHWRTATQEQKNKYLREYERFLLKNYAARFAEYTGATYTITGARDDGDGEFTVSMQMISSEGTKVLVDYRMHPAGGKLKLFDVIVEGVSLITTQRSEFGAVLNSEGVDSLIAKLENKAFDPNMGMPKN